MYIVPKYFFYIRCIRGKAKVSAGFTLIEMIVALGVFVILMTSIAGVFLVVQRSQRTSVLKERLLTDARYVLDSMVGDIRTGIPDYVGYGGSIPSGSLTTLKLLDEDNASITYQRVSAGCPSGSTACVLQQGVPITSPGVHVDQFALSITPSTNPFPGGTKQPIVTIVLTLSSNEGLPAPVSLSVQTSASSRVYGP